MQQLDPDDASLNPTMLLLLNRREAATVRAMLRIVDGLIWLRYPDADQLYLLLSDLYESCASYLDSETVQ
jgi:hypothetical protein